MDRLGRKDFDQYFMDIAHLVSTRATCPRRSVGCVITHENHILSTGFNGSPPGKPHCLDVGCQILGGHCVRATHAEINALNFVPPQFLALPLTVYTTHKPCSGCNIILSKPGNRRIVFV